VSHPALSPQNMTQTALVLSPRILYAALFAVVLLAAAFFVSDPILTRIFLSVGLTLGFLAGMVRFLALRHRLSGKKLKSALSAFVEHDSSPSFLTDLDGEIGFLNQAALERFEDQKGQTLSHALRDMFANPAAIFARLQSRASSFGAAREDIVTRRGHIRLAVHQVGANEFLWRLEDMGMRNANGRGAESLSLPMLTASKTGTILFMNEAMRKLLGARVKTLDRVFNELPLRNGQENEIAAADGPIRSLVAELTGAGGRREIYLLPGSTVPAVDGGGWHFFDELPVPLLRITGDGRVVQANRRARSLLEFSNDKDGEVYLSDLVEGPGRPIGDWLREAVEGRSLHRAEVLKARKPDADVFLQFTLSRVVEDDIPMLVAVLNDATELKTLEAQFVQSQKMQAIGQLAGGVAHDFNNLLTAISGHCDLLLLRHDQADMDYADLVQINQNANRAASLVGQLLAFSRKQNLRPEVLDLRDTLSDLTHLLNRLVGEKTTLTLSHDPALQPILADKRQLEQVLMNLVVNARDAMPEGGEIKIETSDITLTETLKRDRAAVPAGEYVVVKVSDEGVGIPADKQAKIFEPFYTTKRTGEGTGLGLSTAYGIVKQTGGFIFVDSAPGNGTCFTLYFPAYAAEGVFSHGSYAAAKPANLESAQHGKTDLGEPQPDLQEEQDSIPEKDDGVVLLVEDEAPVRAFASRALRMRGYTVLEAENAEEALETLKDTELAIDVFVTDVIMPGMDGPSWVKKALEDRPDVKVVFVSGYAEDDFSDNQARIPNSVFLPKPFSLTDLTKTVRQQLH